MGDGYRVDPDLLNRASQSLGTSAGQLNELVQSLNATVTSNSPWGHDEAGTVFGAAYSGLLGHAMETFQSHVQQVQQASEGLNTWAATVVGVDQAETDSFRSLGAGG